VTPTTAAQVLERAADLLEENGWFKLGTDGRVVYQDSGSTFFFFLLRSNSY
jgi:hypothetical protein